MNIKKLLIALSFILVLIPNISQAKINPKNPESFNNPSGWTKKSENNTVFEAKDSDGLDILVISQKPIDLKITSIPEIILIDIKKDSGNTKLSIQNLIPNKLYYVYEDNFHNLTEITSDKEGIIELKQDLKEDHLIIIKTKRSTKYINSTDGGDCSQFGIWDSINTTCTLSQDVTETIQIDSDNITLDGNNHILNPGIGNFGIYINTKNNITIKNLSITDSSLAIYVNYANYCLFDKINSYNNGYGMLISNANDNEISNSSFTNNDTGVWIYYGGSGNKIHHNLIDYTKYTGMNISSVNTLVYRNTISNTHYEGSSAYGMYITVTGNTVYNNNFIDNFTYNGQSSDLYDYDTGKTTVLVGPNGEGGNYYSSNVDCIDSGIDGICDNPHLIIPSWEERSNTDPAPLKYPISISTELTLYEKAADLANSVNHGYYLGDGETWGGKGWDSYDHKYVDTARILTGYNYWNNAVGQVLFDDGLDCSGLVEWAYNKANNPLLGFLSNFIKYQKANNQYKDSQSGSVNENELRPGDTMYFDWNSDGYIDHTAMFIGPRGGYDVMEAKDIANGISTQIKDVYKNFKIDEIKRFVAFRRPHEGVVAMTMSFSSDMVILITDPDGYTLNTLISTTPNDGYSNDISGQIFYTTENDRIIVYSPILKKGSYKISIYPKDNNKIKDDIYDFKFKGKDKEIDIKRSKSLDKDNKKEYTLIVDNDIIVQEK